MYTFAAILLSELIQKSYSPVSGIAINSAVAGPGIRYWQLIRAGLGPVSGTGI